MTKVFTTYSFMDLLKDYNYVPDTENETTKHSYNVKALIELVSNFVNSRTYDYDFMDLLTDNGYKPVNDNWVKSHSTDNKDTVEIAS